MEGVRGCHPYQSAEQVGKKLVNCEKLVRNWLRQKMKIVPTARIHPHEFKTPKNTMQP